MVIADSIIVFAGRRIDAPGTSPPRFPEQNVMRVEQELASLFDAQRPCAVVGSAACGADLLILESARQRMISTHIVLPFDAARFRKTSVVDRGASWGPRFDAALAYAQQKGRVLALPVALGSDDDAYARATEAIFAEAQVLAQADSRKLAALAVWDNAPRSSADATLQFLELAKGLGFEQIELSTL